MRRAASLTDQANLRSKMKSPAILMKLLTCKKVSSLTTRKPRNTAICFSSYNPNPAISPISAVWSPWPRSTRSYRLLCSQSMETSMRAARSICC
jgi:hypothetical protein